MYAYERSTADSWFIPMGGISQDGLLNDISRVSQDIQEALEISSPPSVARFNGRLLHTNIPTYQFVFERTTTALDFLSSENGGQLSVFYCDHAKLLDNGSTVYSFDKLVVNADVINDMTLRVYMTITTVVNLCGRVLTDSRLVDLVRPRDFDDQEDEDKQKGNDSLDTQSEVGLYSRGLA